MGAPLNPVPQVLRIFLEGFTDNEASEKWGNVLHMSYTGGAPSNATCAAFAAAIRQAWSTNLAPECPAPTSLQSVSVTDLTSDSAGSGQDLTVVNGSRGDDSIPANAAMLVSYPSGLRYRGGHPRTYLYVLGNADLQGASEWSTAATAEVQAHWQAFLTAIQSLSIGGTTIQSVGFVRYRGKFLPNGGPPHYYLNTPLFQAIVIAEAITQQKMASQRRRIGRRRS